MSVRCTMRNRPARRGLGRGPGGEELAEAAGGCPRSHDPALVGHPRRLGARPVPQGVRLRASDTRAAGNRQRRPPKIPASPQRRSRNPDDGDRAIHGPDVGGRCGLAHRKGFPAVYAAPASHSADDRPSLGVDVEAEGHRHLAWAVPRRGPRGGPAPSRRRTRTPGRRPMRSTEKAVDSGLGGEYPTE